MNHWRTNILQVTPATIHISDERKLSPDRNVNTSPAWWPFSVPVHQRAPLIRDPASELSVIQSVMRPRPVASGQNLASSTEEISHHFITFFHQLDRRWKLAGDSPRQPQSEPRSAAECQPREENPALLTRTEKISVLSNQRKIYIYVHCCSKLWGHRLTSALNSAKNSFRK